jgi:glycosyltransferase involved in cell wall biosynthesis
MRVLILGPWPIQRPRHGGQIRAFNIVNAFRARGHEVRFIGIADSVRVNASDIGPHDIAFDGRVGTYMAASGLPPLWAFWASFAEVPDYFDHFAAIIESFRPDIIEVEEPYLWAVVQKLRQRGLLTDVGLIHSSYNFETIHRREMMAIDGHIDEATLALIANQEIEIAREADLVIVVSDQDAVCFRDIGARHVLVARNGSRRLVASARAISAVDAYFGRTPFALFVSSAHPPNARGMLDLADGAEKALPGPLVIAGGVSKLLAPHLRGRPFLHDTRMLGIIEEEVLDALVLRASVVLLPKTRGGGSNLKTAEALVAGRPIVGTDLSFVGFEEWRDMPGVSIANDACLFWQHVARGLSNPQRVTDAVGDDRRNKLLWSNCLAPMIGAAEHLAAARVRPTRTKLSPQA